MKTVFAALNAKYIHVNLALRSIAGVCRKFSPRIREFTINDNIDSDLFMGMNILNIYCYK